MLSNPLNILRDQKVSEVRLSESQMRNIHFCFAALAYICFRESNALAGGIVFSLLSPITYVAYSATFRSVCTSLPDNLCMLTLPTLVVSLQK